MRGRRLILLVALTMLAVVSAGTVFSGASFTSSSDVRIEATTDSVTDWLRIDSSETDPDVADRSGYARQYNSPSLPFVASGGNRDLTIDWGAYPDTNTTYTFNRSFTLRTPVAFPDPSVTQVTVTAVYWVPSGELQPIRSVRIAAVGATGGVGTVTLGPGQKRQVNVQVRAKRQWTPGEQFHAHIVLALTYAGGPTNYYSYDIPTLITVI